MGIYTVLDDKRVDEAIANDLKLIVGKITEAVSVRSIILGGGFGRGEGSVLVTEKGVEPINDYDLFIIVPDKKDMDFRSLSNELIKEIRIRLLDLIPIKYSSLPTLPATQFNYDLKYGGSLLWGEDIMELIPEFKEGQVDHTTGKTLLLNRLICAIESYSEEFETSGIAGEDVFFLANQTGKIVFACVEALLIKKGKYHHSCLRRKEIFEKEFPDKNVLHELNERATEFKLRPHDPPDFNTISYWNDAVHEYLDVISDYLGDTDPLSRKELMRVLKSKRKRTAISSSPIERAEMALLLYREASYWGKRKLLTIARKELEDITKTSLSGRGWEKLREKTTGLWHELCH